MSKKIKPREYGFLGDRKVYNKYLITIEAELYADSSFHVTCLMERIKSFLADTRQHHLAVLNPKVEMELVVDR